MGGPGVVTDRRIGKLAFDQIGDMVAAPSGVFVQRKEVLAESLTPNIIQPDRRIPFISNLLQHGRAHDEMFWVRLAQKQRRGVLLSGPTGTGKSMFAEFAAQQLGLPLVLVGATPDDTKDEFVGSEAPMFATLQNGSEEGHLMTFQQFRPGPGSLFALAEVPVLLFIDELHKMRRNTDTFLHHILQEGVVLLGDHLGAGMQVRISPGTVVMLSVNPDYENGLDAVGIALRQRCRHLRFEIPYKLEGVMEILRANLAADPDYAEIYKTHLQDIERIARAGSNLAKVFLASQGRIPDLKSDDMAVKSALDLGNGGGSVVDFMGEAPSPRILLMAAQAVCLGARWDEAFHVDVVETILKRSADEHVRNAIREMIRNHIV